VNFHRLLSSAFLVTWLATSLRLSGPVLLAAWERRSPNGPAF